MCLIPAAYTEFRDPVFKKLYQGSCPALHRGSFARVNVSVVNLLILGDETLCLESPGLQVVAVALESK